MGKKPTFSGNVELLKSISDISKNQYSLKEGENIEFNYDANTNNNVISVINTPKFDDVILVNNLSLLNELNQKYTVKNDVVINDNSISLNLGSITGLQVPVNPSDASNKKYVDEMLNDFWNQIQQMHYVNFKGRYNDRLTYGLGDLVVNLENNEWFFYLSVVDFNNYQLNDKNGWIKISSPVPSNLVTTDVLQMEIDKLNQRIDQQNAKISNLENKINNEIYCQIIESLTDPSVNNTDYSLFGKFVDSNNNLIFVDNLNVSWVFQHGYIDNVNSSTIKNGNFSSPKDFQFKTTSFEKLKNYKTEFIDLNLSMSFKFKGRYFTFSINRFKLTSSTAFWETFILKPALF